MSAYETLSARAISAGVHAGQLDPCAIVEASLARIDACNGALNALTYVAAEEARTEARGIAARLAAGAALPLAGVPIVVKDNVWVGGMPVTQGSRLFAGFRPPRDAVAVARARAAGAVVVGIGAAPEFACKGFTYTAQLGITRHPVFPEYTPGGSSGGNVAAIGSGMVPVSLGTDGGGSSRRPPAHCGLVGFKPTFGVIPCPYGFSEAFWNLSSISPIGRDVADVALLFAATSGPDPADPDSRAPLPEDTRNVGELRFAVAPMLGLEAPFDSDVMDVFENAVARLSASFGFTRAAPAWPALMTPENLMAIQHSGLAALHGQAYRQNPDKLDPEVAQQIEQGFRVTGVQVATALEMSQQIRFTMADFFATHDILVSLTMPCTAWKIDRSWPDVIGGQSVGPRGHAVLTPMVNHAKTPAITIPCGRVASGLPVGMQIIGPAGADWRVLKVAQAFEALLGAG